MSNSTSKEEMRSCDRSQCWRHSGFVTFSSLQSQSETLVNTYQTKEQRIWIALGFAQLVRSLNSNNCSQHTFRRQVPEVCSKEDGGKGELFDYEKETWSEGCTRIWGPVL